MPASTPDATLLFAHGGGYCKEIWNPIIRRMKDSPLFHGVNAEFVAFDFPYHGTKRDESVPPKLDMSNPKAPRVEHPGQNLGVWGAEEVERQVAHIREKHQHNRSDNDDDSHQQPLIGIGYSMGAVALLNTEIKYPGTFDGLILFEPIFVFDPRWIPAGQHFIDFMVLLTLRRESKWPSLEAAHTHFNQLSNFARWDRESLAAYLKGGLVQESDGSVVLACHPLIECSLYCHHPVVLPEEKRGRPKCRVTFHYGTRSKMFIREFHEPLVQKWPHIYQLGDPMPGSSHAMVMEDPALCATNILKNLQELAPFREKAVRASRL